MIETFYCAWRRSGLRMTQYLGILRFFSPLMRSPAPGVACFGMRRSLVMFILCSAQPLGDWPARGAVDLALGAISNSYKRKTHFLLSVRTFREGTYILKTLV
ncbi:hypothetical protein L195_g042469 [Trifolium pratense]|uniref:Uncharacterized protein n=1 Tax=Trifolium pratense TaxID=57577 RepID=A0A2K3M6H8_TRIPR|nr:hypothetical protein L195_g042469 [Trifolium pratense]